MIRHCTVPSPVGRLRLTADGEVLCGISFREGVRQAAPADPASSEGRLSDEPFREVVRQLSAYFAGELRTFDLAVRPSGTAFQQQVWALLRTIPYGETVSYGELARRLERPRASRAVGAANGSNPIPIVIPCHRVIGANGALTGFGGGLPVKWKLLELESGQRRTFDFDFEWEA